MPSRFIDELPSENIEHGSEAGLYGGHYQGSGQGISVEDSLRLKRGNIDKFASDPTGFTRRKSGHTREGLVIEGEASIAHASEIDSEFQVGVRVFHQKFGYGKVLSASCNKLEVHFEKSGTKKVIDSFVSPA